MTKLSKICYFLMAVSSVFTFVINLIQKNYSVSIWAFTALLWAGSAFIIELRCNKLEREIEDYKKSL